MIYPEFLKKGDLIGAPAPSDAGYDEPHRNRFKNAVLNFKKHGFSVEVSKNINHSSVSRSASAQERGAEINEMFSRADIDFVLCAAGGEFLVECLPYVDFELLAKNPKFVQGFSDPTGLLFPITTKYDIATLYGMNFGEYGMEKWYKNLEDSLKIMQGDLVSQESFEKYASEHSEYVTGLESYKLDTKNIWKTLDGEDARFSGRLIGGCMDLISELAGTKYDGMPKFNERYKKDGVVWYFDNCELSYEETIRTLWRFKELGYFKYTTGIIFGRFGYAEPTRNYEGVSDCLKDSVVSSLGVPVVFDADLSHKDPCMLVINGAIAEVEVSGGKGKILQKLN